MEHFYINQHATLPSLRMELINDGRYDYLKSYMFNNAIQNADVIFSMWNVDNEKIKVSKQSASIILVDEGSCEERYILEYKWKKRDTNEKGQFMGRFTVTFHEGLKEEGMNYESGDLIIPIVEELIVFVK